MTSASRRLPANTQGDTFNAPSTLGGAQTAHLRRRWHGGNTNHRVRPFDKDGKYSRSGARKGKGPGDVRVPHAWRWIRPAGFRPPTVRTTAPVFDQDWKSYLLEWKAVRATSGLFIDKNDHPIRGDNSTDEDNPTRKVGSPHRQCKDGKGLLRPSFSNRWSVHGLGGRRG